MYHIPEKEKRVRLGLRYGGKDEHTISIPSATPLTLCPCNLRPLCSILNGAVEHKRICDTYMIYNQLITIYIIYI